jgi:predicted RNA-binding Zn-ribbon protein involved in translation (DUF1610 family)
VARLVIVRTLCDPCLETEAEVDGEELAPLKLPEISGRPRVLTLCEVHRKEFYDPLVEILKELGQPVDEEGNAAGPRGHYKPRKGAAKKSAPAPAPHEEPAASSELACPACGKVSVNKSALQSHTRSAHDKTLAELRGEELPFKCPECGRDFSRPTGLGAHRFRTHGVQGSSKDAKASREAAAKA